MSIGEISSCCSLRTSSSRSLEYCPSPERSPDLLNDVAAIGSARSDDTQTASIIAIAVKAHEKMLMDPFVYALNHLVKQNDHKVVVICCMSRVRSELGVDLLIDETFSGISKKKLESAMLTQRNNMNHFLRTYRDRLEEKGVLLEIHIYIGRKSDDILVKAATELHPHWVVLDISFTGHQNKIQAALKCDLVLMKKKKDSKPVVLQLKPKEKDLGPVDHIRDQVSEEGVNPILGISSPGVRITYIRTDLTSRQNGASPTRRTEAPLIGHDTGDTATSSTNIKTENGYPAPPVLSPAQVPTPPIHTPLHTERPTESGRPAPWALSWVATPSRLALRRSPSASPTQVATKSLPASMHLSSPLLLLHTIATPPNPPSLISQSKPASQTSSTSRASTTKANPSFSSPLNEPIPYEISLAMAIDASLQTNPPNCTSQSKPGTPTSSSSPAWTGEANPSISRPLSEPIPYETALAMAMSASLLSAKEEGIPVSPSAQQSSSSWNDGESNTRPSDGPVPNDIAPHMALNSSILSDLEEDAPSLPLIRRGCSNHVSASEEGAPLSSSPLPANVSACDGGQGHRGPAARNNAHTDEFGGWLEGEHSGNSNRGSASSAGARTSKPGLSIADVPSTSDSSDSGIPKPTRSPASVLAHSSHQSSTQVASPLIAQWGPAFLPSGRPNNFQSKVVVTVHPSPTAPPIESTPTKKKANSRRDGECVICWDRLADAACIPCGHVAGCMNCMTEIKSDKWRCPVCRVTIKQVLKIYVV